MKRLLLLLCVLVLATPVFAQDGKFEWEDEVSEFDFEERLSLFSKKRPYITLQGGFTDLNRYKIDSSFKPEINGAIALGMEKHKVVLDDETIAKRKSDEFYLSFHTAAEGGSGTMSADIWRFGIGGRKEYGYLFQEDARAGVYLGNGSSTLAWSSVSAQALTADSSQNVHLLRFTDGLRFGESMDATINVRMVEAVSLGVRYDWAQIYPRHMFWYWGLSQIIEAIAIGATDGFIGAIGKSSPAALPIMNFVLRNAVAFGFKALRQNKMNWPFNTEAPLNVQTYSVSIGVHF